MNCPWSDYEELQTRLGVSFRNPSWLREALTHASYVNENPTPGIASNERLEFLGDAVLDLVVAEELFRRFPHMAEGELTQWRSWLVRKHTLSTAARALGLGAFLLMGRGEAIRGGREQEGNLANAFEALVAALYLDQGWNGAASFVLRGLNPWLQEIAEGSPVHNSKSLLQKLVQADKLPPPSYQVVCESGPDHDRRFAVQVLLSGEVVGEGMGKSKQAAEEQAAESALKRLYAG